MSVAPVPLEKPPESMRPDREEKMCDPGEGPVFEIEPGVRFECLVGTHNGARNLTTGIVTLAPAASLTYHTHEFSESITLLEGRAIAAVEGREYSLEHLDNVVIPRGLPHQVRNLSTSEPATFHIAMASDSPARIRVADTFAKVAMPADEPTVDQTRERFNSFRTAPRFEAGPNTAFIDFFNAELLPGIEMSGGYGLFPTGGRLPAHVHDFDESICIIEGEATCIVEGRRYRMKDRATALQPRGRVHYFVNESPREMAMLWVYAGPSPIRIVVDERCATVEGNPWAD